jgi:Predicted esterase of the alpha-beta hydrolase superfamily
MINTKLNKGINRKVTVGSTNLDTGEFINFDESLGSEFLEAIMCSASPPFIFPFQSFQGQSYADGGCLINLDVFQAITRCYEETNNYADIIVDLIFDTKISSLPVSFTFNTIDVMSRVNQISSYNSAIWYYNQAKLAYPKVQFRYVIIPTGDMPGGIVPLNFTQSVLEAEVSMGKTDAANKIKSGENGRDTIERLYQQVKFNIITP